MVRDHLTKIEPRLDQPDPVRFEIFYLEDGHAVIVIQVEPVGALKGINYHFRPVIYKGQYNYDGLTFAYRRVGAAGD